MEEKLYFSGINGDSGDYDLQPMTGDEFVSFIKGEKPPENYHDLSKRADVKEHLGVIEGVDPTKLDESGWGIIFAAGENPAIKEALSELIKHRRDQANKTHEYFRLYEGPDGYRTGESKGRFLARHGASSGPANPKKVPYYLLIVGDPERIPNRFQSQLDVQYAVGRIHFETLDEYANYARSVVEAETGKVQLARDIAMFSVANKDDRSTELSNKNLMAPLLKFLKEEPVGNGWNVNDYLVDNAKKAQLKRLLGGDQTPALLFTASHGMQFDLGKPRQLAHQGALLCQDWPGPEDHKGAVPQDFYFAGDDLSSDAGLLGLIAFFYACFGAGTPQHDEFAKQADSAERKKIAPHNFLAQLPLKMLGHRRGGALAVVGHIDRTWSYSFDWPGAGSQTDVFESTLQRLLAGHPVGSALEYFNQRYAELSVELVDVLEKVEFGKKVDPFELSRMWTANNDARGYTIIGDPAVRMAVAEEGQESSERPVIEVKPIGGNKPAGEAAAKSAAGVHKLTITTYQEGGPEDKVAAETTLAIGDDRQVSENQGQTADDEALQKLHQDLVKEAKAACQAFLDGHGDGE